MGKQAIILSGLNDNISAWRGAYAALKLGYDTVRLLMPSGSLIPNPSDSLIKASMQTDGQVPVYDLYDIEKIVVPCVYDDLESLASYISNTPPSERLFLYITAHAPSSGEYFSLSTQNGATINPNQFIGLFGSVKTNQRIVLTSFCSAESYMKEVIRDLPVTTVVSSLGKNEVKGGSKFNPYFLERSVMGETISNAFSQAEDYLRLINESTYKNPRRPWLHIADVHPQNISL